MLQSRIVPDEVRQRYCQDQEEQFPPECEPLKVTAEPEQIEVPEEEPFAVAVTLVGGAQLG